MCSATPPGTDDIAARGLAARDALSYSRTGTPARVVTGADADRYDLVLVAVRSDQLARACAQLAGLDGSPAVLFFGNNPDGRSALPAQVPGVVRLGFPGVGGVLRDGIADCADLVIVPT